MPRSCGPLPEVTRIRPQLLCWAGARSGRSGLSTGRLRRSGGVRRSSTLLRSLSGRRIVSRGRDYRLLVRRWEVGLEIEIERAEGQLRLQLKHDVPVIVREPNLRVPILGKNSFCLDHGLHDDRVERSGRDLYPLLAQDADPHRVAVGTKIAVEIVSLTNLERDRAQEVQERAIVERLVDRFLLLQRLLRRLDEDGALRIDLESALGVLSAFLELLNEPQRGESLSVHPALVYVVHAIQEIAALHPECGVPGGAAAEIVEGDDLHVSVSNSDRTEPDLVLHSLAGPERNLRAFYRRRYDGLRRGRRIGARRLCPRTRTGGGSQHGDAGDE